MRFPSTGSPIESDASVLRASGAWAPPALLNLPLLLRRGCQIGPANRGRRRRGGGGWRGGRGALDGEELPGNDLRRARHVSDDEYGRAGACGSRVNPTGTAGGGFSWGGHVEIQHHLWRWSEKAKECEWSIGFGRGFGRAEASTVVVYYLAMVVGRGKERERERERERRRRETDQRWDVWGAKQQFLKFSYFSFAARTPDSERERNDLMNECLVYLFLKFYFFSAPQTYTYLSFIALLLQSYSLFNNLIIQTFSS